MDCVRVSKKSDGIWEYDKNESFTHADNVTSEEECSQSCVSNFQCESWTFNAKDGCSMSQSQPSGISSITGATSGVIDCENDYNLTGVLSRFILYIILFISGLYITMTCMSK